MKKYVFAIAIVFALAPVAAQASTIPKAPNNLGLVGYWSFNEGTGTVANDYSGQGNQGIATTTTWTIGKYGNALNFNGTTNYVALSKTAAPATGYTVSAWVNINTSPSAAYGIYDLGVKSGCNPSNQELLIQSSRFRYSVGCGGQLTSTTSVSINTWYFVTLTVSSSKLASLYINGVLDTGPTDVSSGQSLANGNDVIGATWVGGPLTHFFPGKIDEVRVYSRVLSATEIAALYKAGGSKIGAPVSPGTLGQGLLGWWTFDGADIGSSFVDRSGNGFSGYLVGTNNATTSRKTVGKVGQAFKFGGQNTGGVYLGTNASLSPSRFTIAGWVYANTPGVSTYNYIYSNSRDNCQTGLNGIDFKIYTNNASLSGLICTAGVAHSVSAVGAVATSTWTFVAFSYDGANERLYKNGALIATQANTSDPGTPTMPTCLGSMGNGNCGTFTLDGKLDDMRLYNRALSASEIQSLYNLGAGTHANTSSASLDNGTTLASGLVGHWTFDGKDMYQNVADVSGQGNTGYLIGYTSTSSAVTIGRFGQGVHNFSATNYIDVPSSSSLNPGSTITVSAWFYPTGNSVYAPFVSKQDAPTATAGWEMAYNVTNGLLRTTLRGALVDAVGGTITLNKWQLGTFTYDGTTLRLYLNGVQVATASGSATLNSTGDLLIGKRLTNNNYFFGTVDDVRVYNRVLSATEITQLYNLGK